jgi:tRNA 2-selenouridine synthase
MVVLVGATGSGKSDLLHLLAAAGEQVLDVEDLAGHRGSAFGALIPRRRRQPTNWAFAAILDEHLSRLDRGRPVWSEYKGVHIGAVSVPAGLLAVQRAAPQVEVVRPAAARAAALVAAYGQAPIERWLHAVDRIRDRLGSAEADRVADLVRARRLRAAVDLLLPYYDRGYRPHRASLTGPVIAHVDVDAAHAGAGGAPCRQCPPATPARGGVP